MTDWTPDPTRTETLADGTRRLWARRDVVPAPAPQVVPVADVEIEPADPAKSAFGRAQAASAKRFSKSIDSASADLGAGRWTWPAAILFLALCGWSGYSAGVTFGWWGRSVEYPQTQPNVKVEHEHSTRSSGVNHSRDLLIEWSRSVTWKRLRADEQEAARRAVEADR